MGLLAQVQRHREGHPVKPSAGTLTPTKRVMRDGRYDNPRLEGELLVKEWVGAALYFDPACSEYIGSGRRDFIDTSYHRPTLIQSYHALCAERGVVPCSIKTFVRRLLQATEELGGRPSIETGVTGPGALSFEVSGYAIKTDGWVRSAAQQTPLRPQRLIV